MDNDEYLCQNMSFLFREKDYEIETTKTGQRAIQKAQKKLFNIALLDVNLFGIEGIELLAPLKLMYRDIEIIINGDKNLDLVIQVSSNGASVYFFKPLDIYIAY